MTFKGKRVVVTGGTGFIGSFLVERLLVEGAKVRVPVRAQNFRSLSTRRSEIEWVEGDLRDGEYCITLLKDRDHLFHLASHRRNVAFHHEKCSAVAAGNVRMSLALIEALAEVSPMPVTFFSTANIPPDGNVLTIAQGERVDGYVLGKALCEALWFSAAKQYGFSLLVPRPVGVYGPRDTFTVDGNVIPSLLVKARDAKEELEVWGDGTQERAFLYVEDLVEAVFCLLSSEAQSIQYLTTPEVVTIKELTSLLVEGIRPGLPVRYDANRPIGQRVIPTLPPHPCLKRMRWTPLKEGIERTLAWWQKAD